MSTKSPEPVNLLRAVTRGALAAAAKSFRSNSAFMARQ